MKNVGDLKHSALSEWTVLLSKWFQAMTVAGEKRVFVLFGVALCSFCHCFGCTLCLCRVSGPTVCYLLDLNRRPCISVRVGVVEGGAAVTAQLAYLKKESAKSTVR